MKHTSLYVLEEQHVFCTYWKYTDSASLAEAILVGRDRAKGRAVLRLRS